MTGTSGTGDGRLPRHWPGDRAGSFAALGDRVAVHYNASADRPPSARRFPATATSGPRRRRDPDAVQSFVDEAAAVLGRLDVVVNNAAIFPAAPDPGHVLCGLAGGLAGHA